MKKLIIALYILFLFDILIFGSRAEEYTYLPEERSEAEDEINNLINNLPKEIRDKLILPQNEDLHSMASSYDFEYFKNYLIEQTEKIFPKHLSALSTSVGILVIVSLIRKASDFFTNSSITPAVNLCTCFSTSLAIFAVYQSTLTSVGDFLCLLSETMLYIIPVMEAIYIMSGSLTLSATTATGINVMIAFTESIFAKVLSPSVSVCMILSAVTAATGDKAIGFMTKMIRSVITGITVFIMSLMTLSLTVQIAASSAADSFAGRAVRFALGSYIPIVGGSVSESFSLFKSSISTLKDSAGITGIVIILLICAGPILSLIFANFSLFIASSTAGILQCEPEQELFGQLKSSFSLLLAIVISAVVMYIISLSQFCAFAGALE